MLVLPLSGTWAQDDDMYFVPKKKAAKQAAQTSTQMTRYVPVEIVYADDDASADLNITGSNRDVDEYNRRGPSSGSSFSYQVPGNDTLYILDDAEMRNSSSLNVYQQGYSDGYTDGEDYALSRRLTRFGYSSIYTSPWYWSYYHDPYYYDDWYWGVYDPFWTWNSYYWHRPYYHYGYYSWGYSPYYWHGGYYGWNRPYRHYYAHGSGNFHRGMNRDYKYSERYRNLNTASRNYNPRGGYRSTVQSRGNATTNTVRRGQNAPMGSRGGGYVNRGSSTSSSRSGGYTHSSSTRSSSSSLSAPVRSSSSSGGFGGSSRGGGFSSGSSSSGGRSTGGGRGGRGR